MASAMPSAFANDLRSHPDKLQLLKAYIIPPSAIRLGKVAKAANAYNDEAALLTYRCNGTLPTGTAWCGLHLAIRDSC